MARQSHGYAGAQILDQYPEFHSRDCHAVRGPIRIRSLQKCRTREEPRKTRKRRTRKNNFLTKILFCSCESNACRRDPIFAYFFRVFRVFRGHSFLYLILSTGFHPGGLRRDSTHPMATGLPACIVCRAPSGEDAPAVGTTFHRRLSPGFAIRTAGVSARKRLTHPAFSVRSWSVVGGFPQMICQGAKKTHARPEKEAASMPKGRPWCVDA
jgi:hypothetical protein